MVCFPWIQSNIFVMPLETKWRFDGHTGDEYGHECNDEDEDEHENGDVDGSETMGIDNKGENDLDDEHAGIFN